MSDILRRILRRWAVGSLVVMVMLFVDILFVTYPS
jgi:hypothetical protein